MIDTRLTTIRDLIQEDVGNRGLANDPADNLLTAYTGDFAAACVSLAAAQQPRIVVVTGFYIADADPPCGETDGPLGAVFLARALVPLGFDVALATDGYCVKALNVGLDACNLGTRTRVFDLDREQDDTLRFSPTHLIALERVGPNHTAQSIRAQNGRTADIAAFEGLVTASRRDRCYSMRGRDLTDFTRPAHRLFEAAAVAAPRITTIGIGDGGNEIGMGKIPWDTLRRNIPDGGLIACRVPTDHLMVCGVSNWGAYGLAAGVRLLRNAPIDQGLFDIGREIDLLTTMVSAGPLVDGRSRQRTVTVDGLDSDQYFGMLSKLQQVVAAR